MAAHNMASDFSTSTAHPVAKGSSWPAPRGVALPNVGRHRPTAGPQRWPHIDAAPPQAYDTAAALAAGRPLLLPLVLLWAVAAVGYALLRAGRRTRTALATAAPVWGMPNKMRDHRSRSAWASSGMRMAALAQSPDSAMAEADGAAAGRAGQYTVTSLESNSFALQLGSTRLLIDPWLVGPLVFGDAPWLFEGRKRRLAQLPFTPEQVPQHFDAVVLTQGLDDHAHRPTLRRIPKNTLVVANPQAAEVCRELGFKNVHVLRPGASTTVKDVEIQAFRGSLVGPPWSEPQNGYCFRAGEFRVVTEPHGNFPALSPPCDVLICPVMAQRVVGYPLVNGVPEAVAAAQRLQPALVVPLENAAIDSDGALAAVLQEVGSLEAFQRALRATGLPTRVRRMQPYRPVSLLPEQDVAMATVSGTQLPATVESLKQDLFELVRPLNYGADMGPDARAAVLALVDRLRAANPTPAPAASPLLDARWRLLWTTEKEQLFFVSNGFFGSRFTAAKQDIDRASGRLQNLIEFEGGDYFQVSSSLIPQPPARCNFQFQACRCRRGPVSVPLPPVGQGWFDTVFLDETLRIAQDIRGDTLIVVRDDTEDRFTVPSAPQ